MGEFIYFNKVLIPGEGVTGKQGLGSAADQFRGTHILNDLLRVALSKSTRHTQFPV